MKFEETSLGGAFLIHPELHDDERGYFARMWCAREFAEHGLNPAVAQTSLSHNRMAGTLRGLHFQADPHAETKLVRCVRGAIYDVIVDLRPGSATYLKWLGVVLSAANGLALYIPPGCAHGFQTLEDDSDVYYQMSEFYVAEAARGYRWDDPALRIEWPAAERRIISTRDMSWLPFAPAPAPR